MACSTSKESVGVDPREKRLHEFERNMEDVSDQNPIKIQYNKLNKDSIIFTLSITDSIYWQMVNPLDFVDTLAKYKNGFKVVVTTRPNPNWLDKKNRKKLEKLTSDTRNCAPVIYLAPEISHIPQVVCRSNIGQEVIYMLDCFERGSYPARQSSCNLKKEKAANKM